MKRKTESVQQFMADMHNFITCHRQFRKKTQGKSEVEIQRELRPILIEYLDKYFNAKGYSDSSGKAHEAFYWEGQEGKYGRERRPIFGSRNYPDFIIEEPYLIAVEYKQSPNGSVVKHGIGQSMMYTLCEEFDFVYYLFHDQSEGKRIETSSRCQLEGGVIQRMWDEFNVYIKFI